MELQLAAAYADVHHCFHISLPIGIYATAQVSGKAPAPRAMPAMPALEQLWKLSKAGPGQKTGAAILGAVNFVGVTILQGILSSRQIAMAISAGSEVGAYAIWISRFMPFLQVELLCFPHTASHVPLCCSILQ